MAKSDTNTKSSKLFSPSWCPSQSPPKILPKCNQPKPAQSQSSKATAIGERRCRPNLANAIGDDPIEWNGFLGFCGGLVNHLCPSEYNHLVKKESLNNMNLSTIHSNMGLFQDHGMEHIPSPFAPSMAVGLSSTVATFNFRPSTIEAPSAPFSGTTNPRWPCGMCDAKRGTETLPNTAAWYWNTSTLLMSFVDTISSPDFAKQ